MPAEHSAYLLQGLNESQKAAVSAPPGNLLVIAGAGTGKTRVLVARIAYLIEAAGVEPREILAVTFTNKAAGELRERIAGIVGRERALRVWAGTFHSICHRFLRAYARQAGLDPGFGILDGDNQLSLVKRIIADLGVTLVDTTPRAVASRIAKLKERRVRATACPAAGGASADALSFVRIYREYEKRCLEQNVVDFSELLLRTVELFEYNESLRDLQQRRFRELLVDEFQDTNRIQLDLLRIIKGGDAHIMAVGDDDQSIYGWRGAEYQNLFAFREIFRPVDEIMLQSNYRSTQAILDMANALMKNETHRLAAKVLVGNHGRGEPVAVVKCSSELAEARAVARVIQREHAAGRPYQDFAVLYRTNRQSLLLEQRFSSLGLPYVIFGGQKFFERAEIQDALAYMRVLLNDKDDQALMRIINVPPRRIGPKLVEQLSEIAYERGCSLYQALALLIAYARRPECPGKLSALAARLKAFYDIIEELRELRAGTPLDEFVSRVIRASGLFDYYRQKDEKERFTDNVRHQNLEQLVSNARTFASEEPGEDAARELLSPEEADPLLDFISRITLSSSAELSPGGFEDGSGQGRITLMTIHSAKGLEFKTVFLVGFEKDLLPYYLSFMDSDAALSRQEEERRLAYVGITRARERLYLSYCLRRLSFGRSRQTGASDFLREIVAQYDGVPPEDRPYEILPLDGLG